MTVWKLSELNSGSLNERTAKQLCVSFEGCPHRGTPECFTCSYAVACAAECEYQCARCRYRGLCPCGWLDDDRRQEIYRAFVADRAQRALARIESSR